MTTMAIPAQRAQLWTRQATGIMTLLPHAGRTLYEELYRRVHKALDINLLDREWAKLCGVKRRCIQKAWRQLELLGIVKRTRDDLNRRIIKWLTVFAGKNTEPAKSTAANAKAPPSIQNYNPPTAIESENLPPGEFGRRLAEMNGDLGHGMRVSREKQIQQGPERKKLLLDQLAAMGNAQPASKPSEPEQASSEINRPLARE
jgi:hypothetical protein